MATTARMAGNRLPTRAPAAPPVMLAPLPPRLRSAAALAGQPGQPGLLGLTCIGAAATTDAGGLPLQHVAAPLLFAPDGGDPFYEAWRSARPCRAGERDGVRFRADGDVLYGVLVVDEEDFAAAAGRPPLQQAAEAAYRRIFRLLDEEGYPGLWRVWNYLAGINAETPGGIERYREFNAGRQDAFVACGRITHCDVPAACALGVRGGPLSVAFIAGRTPALPIENPRQVSAWDYPPDYGPRAPTFARAALARLPGQEWLFVSGTASIVGHRTLHAGDVAAQTREAMANVAAVVAEANGASGAAPEPYTLAGLDYRVYVRHAGDFGAVRGALAPLIGGAAAVYVQADVCRADLLVEIEASASRPLGPAE